MELHLLFPLLQPKSYTILAQNQGEQVKMPSAHTIRASHFTWLVFLFGLWLSSWPLAKSQTAGSLSGTVWDPLGGVIADAQVDVKDPATGIYRKARTDVAGNFGLHFLPIGTYQATVFAAGFVSARFEHVRVTATETAILNVALALAGATDQVIVREASPLVQSRGAQLGTSLGANVLPNLPLPTRNYMQVLALSPGVSTFLNDNSAIGRNSPNVSVNGARFSQNNFQVNGINVNNSVDHGSQLLAIPAPESIHEVMIQTSLYDASMGGAAGGQIQVVTLTGTNQLHGNVYEYFRNEALNANDANLKAVRVSRPVMRQNIYGATLGGPVWKNKLFYFVSYQGTRSTNGATDQSLYRNVLIAPGLTTDRSEATLLNAFQPKLSDGTPVTSINQVSLSLLNAKLANGQFLIPTPQTADGRVSGTAISTYQEDQFNTNLDLLPNPKNSLTLKFFYSNSPQFNALGGASVPGFGTWEDNRNRVLSLQYVHYFGSSVMNEARIGYNFIGGVTKTQTSLLDSDVGIRRSTAALFPGLPNIQLARDAGGAAIGFPGITADLKAPSVTATDTLSLERGEHLFRAGADLRSYRAYGRINVGNNGEIAFASFNDFLTGNTDWAFLTSGLSHRDFVSADYNFFLQDDWKISTKWTLSTGLRYELDLPPYDTRGRLSTFDAKLYRPPTEVDENGFPLGPPTGGIVQAGNVVAGYDLPTIPNVGKRLLNSVDPNNFAPRVGLAWSPLNSGRVLVRSGYGVFYSRASMWNAFLNFVSPPFFLAATSSGQPIENPFGDVPPESQFPLLAPGPRLAGQETDRNLRTPYFQQFNASVQWQAAQDVIFQLAYVGTRGVALFRSVPINQAPIASLSHPVINDVTHEVITVNTDENAILRAPLQGVATDQNSFTVTRSDGQSTYHSLQATVIKRAAHGLQFLGSYTLSKSIDNGSAPGGGARTDGTFDRSSGGDSSIVVGNRVDPRANRGLSDFDRTHRFVFHGVWDLPKPKWVAKYRPAGALSNWQLSWIAVVMSGLPVEIFDFSGGSLYGLVGARPSWAPGAAPRSSMRNIPPGYYFNPLAFTASIVQPGQPILSAHDPTALAGEEGADVGEVGRNILRGPRQTNVDLSIAKHFLFRESRTGEFRADFFNAFNHASRCNPISDLGASGDFGRIVGTCSSARIVQLSLKFVF